MQEQLSPFVTFIDPLQSALYARVLILRIRLAHKYIWKLRFFGFRVDVLIMGAICRYGDPLIKKTADLSLRRPASLLSLNQDLADGVVFLCTHQSVILCRV